MRTEDQERRAMLHAVIPQEGPWRPWHVSRWAWDGRLWHALVEGRGPSMCGKTIPLPRRELKNFIPCDDVLCARCSRAMGGLDASMEEE